MLELSLDILLGYALAHIEAPAAGTCITLSADVTSGFFLLLVLIQSLGGTDGQISVIQLYGNLILLEARKINLHLVAILHLLNICLHQVTGSSAVQLLVNLAQISVIEKWEIIKPVIK